MNVDITNDCLKSVPDFCTSHDFFKTRSIVEIRSTEDNLVSINYKENSDDILSTILVLRSDTEYYVMNTSMKNLLTVNTVTNEIELTIYNGGTSSEKAHNINMTEEEFFQHSVVNNVGVFTYSHIKFIIELIDEIKNKVL